MNSPTKPIGPLRMFFLNKIFQLRDQSNPSAEKPFLEHLEDLRVCITRIVLTLLIATIGCFIFRNELMDIIRRPVTQVWEQGEQSALKDTGIDLEKWEDAKKIAEVYNTLDEEDREHYLREFEDPDEILADVRTVNLFRAALTLEDEVEQRDFIESHSALDEALQKKVLALIEGGPNPRSDARGKLVLMQALKPTEGFMLSIKLAFFAGIVISFPFLLFFLLQFVLPGMHDTERKALWPAMAIGFGLFLCGVFFSYYIVLPEVLEFFHEYSSDMMIENEWRIGYYISFATQFTLIFGLSFELPVLVMTLVKLGVLNCEMMRRTRAYAVLAIFVIAALITPTPDAFTLCLLAGPMVILYEICIWLALLLERKTARREAEEERERLDRMLEIRKRKEELGDAGGSEAGQDTPEWEESEHDPYDQDHDPHHHDEYHDDHDTDADHYHTDDEAFRADHHEEGDLGYGDDGHTGEDHESSDSTSVAPDEENPEEQQGFDFHEESDPSESRPDEEEHLDPHDPPEDIPDEERYRDRDNPGESDQD